MRRVGDRFVLVRELGSGGMSAVFLGRDEVLDRPVAVKILHPDLDDEETGALFRKEGRTAARLSHPNIIQVYDAGEDLLDGRQVSYIVMEYAPGGDLKALMDRRGSLPEGMLSRVGADVAAALSHAHERGVIHRDVKPRNVLLDERGNPKLADFGIARAFETTEESRAGSYLGTAAYSSPEQLQGHKVTPKSDVYSLGATLYHAATGEPPFSGAPIEVANQQVLKEPTPPRERGARIGGGLEALILTCLAKNPEERPDAVRVHEKLFQRGIGAGAAQPEPAKARKPAGAAGFSRAVGTARSAGLSGFEAVRRRLESRGSRGVEGPPDETVSLPTRTFRSGSRQRTTAALLIGAVLLLLLAGAAAWAMLDPSAPTTEPASGGAGEQKQVAAPEQEPVKNQSGQDSAGGSSGDDAGGETQDPGPAPPLAEAESAVFDMYVDQSFQRVDATWAALSGRLQDEIGSPQEWAEQEDLYTFEYMEYVTLPAATASGDEARVSFEARLDHTWGSEVLSGTWVCVVEDGEWKLDRLEDERTTPA
ncbi:protein kinase [Rubrobacter tropicus]|uniref:non-specific serine/threonine protein kinase n=1 Tax=Rubrobacter tropicus TaxID=2653851 RepID=A0A6G8QBC3_9ACTN|nr:serine/threonine-protein kinase [Rubrobacter tropicus]QIN83794.1 protein kinase [Rubrobacter tropicus]